MVLTGAVKLRIFQAHWVYAFAVAACSEDVPRRSLRACEVRGDAVHMIRLWAASEHGAWVDVVADLSDISARQTDLGV
jgi:putative heme degradation protein